MVTYYNRKDLVSFGSYLLSENRKSRFEVSFDAKIKEGMTNLMPVEDSVRQVHHSDIENWIDKERSK